MEKEKSQWRKREDPVTVERMGAIREQSANSGGNDRFVLRFAESVKAGKLDAFDLLDDLPHSVTLDEPSGNVYEAVYRSIFNVAREHPELTQQLGEMENLISQDPQMLRPSELINIAADVMWDPRVHSYLKTNMLHGLGYALRFMQSGEYERAIATKLDFTHTEHFSDTAHFLEFMQSLYNIGDEYSYAGDNIVISRIHEALARAVEKKQGSYLLNVRAQELLAEMDGRSWVSSGFDRLPFKITKDSYAWHKDGGLYISGVEQRPEIERHMQEMNVLESELRPPQYLIDEAIANGESEVKWMPDQQLMRRRNDLYDRLNDLIVHPLTYAELSPGEGEVDDDVKIAAEHDFAYLQRGPIRETVKNDFEVEIGNLSLVDQYKLLKTLKTVEYGKATPLLLEATRAMWRSGIKDYLGEIRGGSLDTVVGTQISAQEKDVIRAVQERLYAEKYPAEEIQDLRKGLNEALESEFSRFYIYRKDGEIVTFVRFDDLSGARDAHMGSFMTNPKFEGGALGHALLDVALKKEINKGVPLFAECDPSLVPFYEKFGFVKLSGPYLDDHGVETCDIGLFPPSSESEPLREAA